MCVPGACGGQKLSESLELLGDHKPHMSGWNRTQVLYKSYKYS